MKKISLRLIALVLMAVLVFGTVSTAFAFSKNEVVVSTISGVNVRKGPSTKYASIGLLSKGEEVVWLAKSGSWSKVTYDGQTAYVYSKYLEAKSGSSTSTTMYATTGVNVRAGAGTSYQKLGALREDQAVTRVGTSGKWIKIVYGTSYGYVHSKYLTTTVPDGVQDTTNNNSNNPGTTVDTSRPGTLGVASYIYKEASYYGGNYGVQYPAGTVVYLTGSSANGFAQIYYGMGYGYVPSGIINSGSISGNYYQRYVTTPCTVYSNITSAGGSGEIGTLAVNKIVTCVSSTGDYTRIVFGGGYGYVLTACLSASGSGSIIGGGTGGIGIGGGTGGIGIGGGSGSIGGSIGYGNNTVKYDVPVYSAPTNTGNSMVGYIAKNQRVYCTGAVVNGYAQIVLSNNTYGYVNVNALTNAVSGNIGGGSTGVIVTKTLKAGSYMYNNLNSGLAGVTDRPAVVTVLADYGTWVQVRLPSGDVFYTVASNLY